MRSILTFILLAYSVSAYSQPAMSPTAEVKEVKGSIIMPPLSNLKVNMMQSKDMDIRTFEALMKGKEYANYATLDVKSNRPWMVTVAAKSPKFYATTASGLHDIPVNVVMLKRSNTNEYITLSTKPQVILKSENNMISNQYTIDLKLQPQFNNVGGKYDLDMVFVLTPQ